MAVVDPVKLIIENYPEGQEEWVETENNPKMKMPEPDKFRSPEKYTLKEKTLKKKLIINSSV